MTQRNQYGSTTGWWQLNFSKEFISLTLLLLVLHTQEKSADTSGNCEVRSIKTCDSHVQELLDGVQVAWSCLVVHSISPHLTSQLKVGGAEGAVGYTEVKK